MQIQSTYLPCRIMKLHLVYFLFSYKGYMKYLEMFIYFAKLAFPFKRWFSCFVQTYQRFDWWVVCCFGFYRKTKLSLSVGTISTNCFFQFRNHCCKSIRKAATFYFLHFPINKMHHANFTRRTLLFFSYTRRFVCLQQISGSLYAWVYFFKRLSFVKGLQTPNCIFVKY